MASDLSFVEFVVDQINNAGVITYRKMFGEYVVYSDRKVVALICDNQLYVKPTSGGRSFIGDVVEAPPYPRAKLAFLIDDRIEDRDWISCLIQITARELPEPKPKKKKISHTALRDTT
ncbi:TfoX/Sxy family protein [bacterium]|nr:TfoX/Sxy family protein [bacterium]